MKAIWKFLWTNGIKISAFIDENSFNRLTGLMKSGEIVIGGQVERKAFHTSYSFRQGNHRR